MRTALAARCFLIALYVLLLSSPAAIQQRFGSASHPFFIATLLVIAVNVVLVWSWKDSATVLVGPARPALRAFWSIAIALAGALLVFIAARAWLHEILIYPHDSWRADMLVVIQRGIKRLLQGHTPYAMYDVPWPAPLPYGPVMWLPLVVPSVAHADVRFVTVAAALFLPVACAFAASAAAQRGERILSAALLALLAAVALGADLRHFMSIGHTQTYWPLVALFAWLFARERWRATAVVCGLLIVARTTMIAVAPVLLAAVWFRRRDRFAAVVALLAAATVLPYLPFLVADFGSVKYALYDSYQHVMKTWVWEGTTWAQQSIGITGRLLARGWKGAVEPVQIVTMIAVYLAAWRAIARGSRPLPWLAFALLAFSMTTLWPVIYVYYDVMVLLAAAVLAETPWVRARGIAASWLAPLAASAAIVLVTAYVMIPGNASIDAGTGPDRPHLYKGFSNDERGPDRSFAWVDGSSAEILVPRRSRGDATIEIVCQPYLPPAADASAVRNQQMHVALNGIILGTATLREGWQEVSFPAPGRAWQYGVNELTLAMSSAVSPREAGDGQDPRRLSVAVDRLTVRSR